MTLSHSQSFPTPCFVGLLVLTLLSPVFALASDWPQFLGPHSNAISQEKHIAGSWPDEGPKVIWRQTIGTGYSAPSIQGETLYLFHRIDNEEILEARNKTRAELLWKQAYPTRYQDPYGYNNGPRCTPLISQDRCYVFGAEGALRCFNAKTGVLIWMRDTASDWTIPSAFFGVGSSPIIFEDLLLVMVGGQPDSGVVALNAATGKTVWESVGQRNWEGRKKLGWPGEPIVVWQDWEKQASYSSPVLRSIKGQNHLLCLMRQGLVSLDPKTGAVHFQRWFRARVNESVNAINPVVHEDKIFISAAYYRIGSMLLEVGDTPDTFSEVWKSDVLEAHWSTPILHEGFLYAFSGRNEPDSRFRCVEFETGRLMWDRDESWRRITNTPDKYGRGSAILADGKLIVLGEGGLLGLFEPTPDQPKELARWQVPDLSYPSWTAPVLSDGKVYLRDENSLICLDLSD